MTAPKAALATRFANAMQGLSLPQGKPVAIAFSGGGDSLALLALLCDLCPGRDVHALIVDHALRTESADEARRAAALATALGAKARILTSETPRAGHKHARTARYTLLAKACEDLGTKTLFLAHTLDDQEETFAIRLARGSRARGLAAMSVLAPFPVWPEGRDLWLTRPMLAMRREELRNWLLAQNLCWIEDPSNQNRRYARVRVRQQLSALRAGGLPSGRIAKSIQLLGQIEQQNRQQAKGLLDQGLHVHPAGYARLRRDIFLQAPAPVRDMALGAVLASIAGQGATPLSSARVQSVSTKLQAGPMRGFCAVGCRLAAFGPDILISRDPGAVLGRAPHYQSLGVPVKAGQTLCFDNRFYITATMDGWIEALGKRSKLLPPQDRKMLMTLPAPVRPVVPVIRDQSGALSSPVLGGAGQINFLAEMILSRKLAPFSHGTV